MMDDDKPTKPSVTEWNPFKLFHWQNEDFDAGIFGENVLNTLEDVVLDVKRGLSPYYKSNALLERSILTAKTRRWPTLSSLYHFGSISTNTFPSSSYITLPVCL